MSKNINWEFIKSEFEETDKSIRGIATENGISHTSIQKKIKSENWIKPVKNEDINKMLVNRYDVVGKVAKRKIKEIVEVLGNNYLPTYEPLIIVFASSYEMWLHMKKELNTVGVIHTTSKGTKQMSVEFRALKEIEKTLKELGMDLGLSVSSGMKLGLSQKVETEPPSIFDLNKKRAQMVVNV